MPDIPRDKMLKRLRDFQDEPHTAFLVTNPMSIIPPRDLRAMRDAMIDQGYWPVVRIDMPHLDPTQAIMACPDDDWMRCLTRKPEPGAHA